MKEKIIKIVKNKIFIAIICILLPVILEFIISKKIEINSKSLMRMGFVYGIYVIIGVFYILSKFSEKINKIADFIMKYRYLIAGIVLIIMVLFNINFSSLNMWTKYLNEPEENNVLIGYAREIRSDEWITQSPYMVGQANSSDGYNVHSSKVGQGTGNMLMISAPVNDIVEISRPLLWGFHFLDVEHGYSFYWSLKFIALIMLSIEIVKKVTNNKNSLLSIIGGFVLAVAPAMMWWASTAIVDGYIYGMAIVVLFSYYMQNLDWKIWKKLLLALGVVICLPGFVSILYPAFQVPFGILMAVFMINDLIQNWRKLKKVDYILIVVAIIAAAGLVARFLLLSLEDMKVMMNTVYPGQRIDTGGNFTTNNIADYYANIFFPYTKNLANTCEPSTHIYPILGLVILLVAFIKDIKTEKQERNFKLTISLIVLYIIYLLWEYVGFNEMLAKISFLYFSPAQRANVVFGMIGTLLTFIMLSKFKGKKIFTKGQAIVISLIAVFLSYVIIKQSTYAGFFNELKYEIVFVMVFALTYFLITGKEKKWLYTMFIVAFVAGATINPISIGIGPLTKTEIAGQIKQISEEDKDALWAGENNYNGQYLIANDVKTLNGVNEYPNFKWLEIVDPDKTYNDIYNRFAHIGIQLGEKTEFVLVAPDAYIAYLTYDNLKDIGVKYYFSSNQMSDEIVQAFKLNEKYSNLEKSQFIYEIN